MKAVPSKRMPLADLCVLVVDDHASTRRLVADVLRAGGVDRVITAESGEEALELMARVRPGALITDWLMPGMDGAELVRTIRQAAVNGDRRIPDPRLPIIMLTSERRRADVERSRGSGVNAFLVKPFTPATVLQRVAMVVSRQSDFVISAAYVGPDRRHHVEENSYGGPLRRRSDTVATIDQEAYARLCQHILEEMETFKRLVEARGFDHLMRQMACRVMHDLGQRAREIGDRTLERSTASLGRYVSAVGGANRADTEVVQIHLETIRALAMLPYDDVASSATIVQQLDRAVSRRIKTQTAALPA